MIDTSALKEKVHGLKLIFSERSTTVFSITTFVLILLLVSAKYIQSTPYALVVGIFGVIWFGFLFPSWILFGLRSIGQLPGKKGKDTSRKGFPNLSKLSLKKNQDKGILSISPTSIKKEQTSSQESIPTIGPSPPKEERDSSQKSIRTIYIVAVIATVIGFAGLSWFYLLFLFVVINLACYAWAFIENYYLAKSIYGTSGRVAKTSRVGRLAIHFIGAGAYAVYLIYKVAKAFSAESSSSITLPFAIDQNMFDWVISLVMFLYAFAGMGVRFLKPASQRPSDTEATAPGRKEASIIVTMLFLTLGFHLFVDGLPIMLASLFNLASQAEWLLNVQEGFYTIFRLTCFLPIMIARPFQKVKDSGIKK